MDEAGPHANETLKSKAMKAICIKDGQWVSTKTGQPESGPKYMEEVTIVDDFEGEWWVLAEYPFPDVFWKGNFILKGDHDESVRLEAYLEEQENMDKILMALAETADEPMPQDAFERNWAAIKQRLNLTHE